MRHPRSPLESPRHRSRFAHTHSPQLPPRSTRYRPIPAPVAQIRHRKSCHRGRISPASRREPCCVRLLPPASLQRMPTARLLLHNERSSITLDAPRAIDCRHAQHSPTRLLSALCSLLSALCSLLSALCSLLSALCSLLSALCSLLSALCSLLSALCSLLSALCSLLSALCSLLSALCSLLSALCSLLSALCRELAAQLGDKRPTRHYLHNDDKTSRATHLRTSAPARARWTRR